MYCTIVTYVSRFKTLHFYDLKLLTEHKRDSFFVQYNLSVSLMFLKVEAV